MPHLVILYTPNIETQTDMSLLCRRLADAMLRVKDETGKVVFPIGGTRVFAYPASHFAVADGSGDHAFIYFNLRMARGRSEVAKKNAGELVTAAAREHLGPLLARRAVGLTLQVDEGDEVFDAKFGNLHALFNKT
jgi:5-carboxymethyl-2-hydroxymuconate isomerase